MKILAAALMLSVANAPPPTLTVLPQPCVSRAEVEDMVSYLLPEAMPSIARKCASSLPAGAWLTTQAPAYAARLAEGREAHWPGVRSAFIKIGGPPPAGVKESDLRTKIDTELQTKLLPVQISAADCATIDEAGRLLAPLPPENLVRLFSLVLQKASSGERRSRGVPVCPVS